MKRLIALLFAVIMLFSLAACRENTTDNGGDMTINPEQSTPSQDTHTHSYTS